MRALTEAEVRGHATAMDFAIQWVQCVLYDWYLVPPTQDQKYEMYKTLQAFKEDARLIAIGPPTDGHHLDRWSHKFIDKLEEHEAREIERQQDESRAHFMACKRKGRKRRAAHDQKN